jgi:hypothetical protein
MSTTQSTPGTTGERDNTVRVRHMTDDEKSGEVAVVVGQATEPLVGVEAPAVTGPVFEPTREMKSVLKDHQRARDMIAKNAAVIADDDAKDAAKKKAVKELEDYEVRQRVHAGKLRAFGYTLDTDASDPVPPTTAVMSKADRYKQAAANDPKHVPGASGGQHVRVREFITTTLAEEKKDVTPQNILRLTGYPSYQALEDVAAWKGTRQDLEPLQSLGENFRGDSWAQGRYLAAIVVAFIRRVRMDADAAKAAAKADAAAAKAAARDAAKVAPVDAAKDDASAPVADAPTEA